MDFKTLVSLTNFIGVLADEVETEDQSAEDIMEKEVASDPAVQEAVLIAVRRSYAILKPRIDDDRIGELVLKAGMDPDFFDRHLADA